MQTKKTCIIVHRSPRLCAWLRNKLSGMGCTVAGDSTSAEEGFRLACLLKPDFMLVDVALGGDLAGLHLVRDIQEQLPMSVIYITDRLSLQLLDVTRSTKPVGFLNKPLRASDLLGMLAVSMSPSAHQVARFPQTAERTMADYGLNRQLHNVLDCLAVGVVIVCQELKLRYANLMGRRIMRNRTMLQLTDGRLGCTDSSQDAELHQLVQVATGSSLILGQTEGRTLRVMVYPILAHSNDGIGEGTPCSVLYLIDLHEQLSEMELQMRREYQLTQAESKVTRALLVRPGKDAVAEQLYISTETVSTHLQHIYAKFGVHSQCSLIHRIMMGPIGSLLRAEGLLHPPRPKRPNPDAKQPQGGPAPQK